MAKPDRKQLYQLKMEGQRKLSQNWAWARDNIKKIEFAKNYYKHVICKPDELDQQKKARFMADVLDLVIAQIHYNELEVNEIVMNMNDLKGK